MGQRGSAIVLAFLAAIGSAVMWQAMAEKNDASNDVTISPAEDPVALVNPGKGWVSYANNPSDASAEELALASVGYRRYEWATIEPEPGHVHWKSIDKSLNAWSRAGKQFAFGVMTANTHSRAPGGYVTPKWVFDAGAPQHIKVIPPGADPMTGLPGTTRMPDFNSPAFIRSLESLVRALAERYDGDPRIAFIDVRSFGNWGESLDRDHVRLWKKYFTRTWLCNAVNGEDEIAQTRWLAGSGVAVRRDGIGGSDGASLAPALGQVPAIFEFWGPVAYLESRHWWDEGRLIPRAIETGKPTFVELCRESPEFLAKFGAVARNVTNRIGFHFVIHEATYPAAVRSGQPARLRLMVDNRGVAPIYYSCSVALAVLDADGAVVGRSTVRGMSPKDWLPDCSIESSGHFQLAGVPPGGYRLAIGLFFDDDSPGAAVRFANKLDRVGSWQVLGQLQVQ